MIIVSYYSQRDRRDNNESGNESSWIHIDLVSAADDNKLFWLIMCYCYYYDWHKER